MVPVPAGGSGRMSCTCAYDADMLNSKPTVALALAALVFVAGCGSDSASGEADTASTTQVMAQASTGVRVVSPAEAADIHSSPPPGLVVLDVRTPEEFAAGHLEGAIMIDFYRDDFSERLAELDPNQPYLLYCRSGNRSEQSRSIMEAMGFTDVADLDGGILAWSQAGYPVVAP